MATWMWFGGRVSPRVILVVEAQAVSYQISADEKNAIISSMMEDASLKSSHNRTSGVAFRDSRSACVDYCGFSANCFHRTRLKEGDINVSRRET